MTCLLRIVLAAAVMGLVTHSAQAMKIVGDAQGNIVQAGTPLTFAVSEAKGGIKYVLTDYFGATIRSGEGATIALAGLNPGWYTLTCRDEAGEASTTLGVLINRGDRPLPKDGRVAVDTIGAGSGLAKLVRLAGIPWVRERFWWNVVQGGVGPIDWKDYPAMAKAIASEGLQVSQVYHDYPAWILSKNPNILGPEDLREIYKMSRTLAEKFAGQWDTWETGNEPDLAWSGRGERFAAYEKAAYLGIRDGNPKAIVAAASVGFGKSTFCRQIYECGLADYSDVLNWHFYGGHDSYVHSTEAYRSLLTPYGADSRPVWVTEGGWPLPRPLTREHQQEITRVVPKNIVMAFVGGNDRYFWFCMPDHFERGLQFNLINGDTTPLPQFVAYSAAANMLGESEYLGEYPCGRSRCYAFSTPRGTVLAVWSEKAAELSIPTERSTMKVADIFGCEREVKAERGQVTLAAGPETIYVIDAGDAVKKKLIGKVRPRGVITAKTPSRVVLSAYSELPVNSERGVCCFETAAMVKPFAYSVEVYNFDAKVKKSGTIALTLPTGWKADRMEAPVAVEAMGREIVSFTITPTMCQTLRDIRAKIRVEGRFGEEKVSPCVSYFGYEALLVPSVGRTPIDWAEHADRWVVESGDCGNANSVNVPVAISAPKKNWIRVTADAMKIESGSDDKFTFAALQFSKPVDLSEYDGIAFTTRGVGQADGIALMLRESSGSQYFLTVPCEKDAERKLVVSFGEMRWAMWFTSDPNVTLDLKDIVAVRVGRSGDKVAFEVGEFELVKFTKP